MNECQIRGCRHLEWKCHKCGRIASNGMIDGREWRSVKESKPPCSEWLLVVKHFIDQEFSQETGGYSGRTFNTPTQIELDVSYREGSWEGGGVITHWMPLPEKPL